MKKYTIKQIQLLFACIVVIGVLLYVHSIQERPTPIGVLLPLTGVSASIGERVKAGVEAGVAELAQNEGIQLHVIIEDDKGEAANAVAGVQKLIAVNKTRVIIGTVKSDAMLAVAPVTESSKVLLISPTAGASSITAAGDFVFRVIETPDVHGSAAAKRLAGKQVALLSAQASNAQSYADAFKKSLGTLVYESTYSKDETDYRTLIAKARASRADAFYLAVATAKDAGLLLTQIRQTGFTGVVMVSVAADAKEFFDVAGVYAEGTVLTASAFDPSSPAGKVFNDRYKSITGKDGDGFSANGYDAVVLIGRAVKKCGEDSVCIRDFLYAIKDYQGAGGVLSFDSNGDVSKNVVYKVAHGGVFIVEK